MKKLYLFLILICIGTSLSFAQNLPDAKVEKRMKEVQEYKMKYLAQEMELSETQKKKFFEIYEEMAADKQDCYKDAINLNRKIKHDKNASEEDYQQVTQAFNKANADWAEKEQTYNQRLSEFLSQKQIYKMREAEDSFRAKFEEMKHARKREHKK